MAVSAARSDVGRKRTINEDSYVADDGSNLFVVADGMGGHAGGEVASQITAETLKSFVSSSGADSGITWPFGFTPSLSIEANQLKNAIQLANQHIISRAAAEPALQGLGSTVIACMITGASVVYGNVGDSRLYLWRDGKLSQVSEDDSWAASMLRAGASADMVRKHEMRHVLTRALGSPLALKIEISEYPLQNGDVLLLCSDGLYGPLGDEGIARILATPGLSFDERAQALIDGANKGGGPDNITAVLVRHEVETTAVMVNPFMAGSPWTSGASDADAVPQTDRIVLAADGSLIPVQPADGEEVQTSQESVTVDGEPIPSEEVLWRGEPIAAAAPDGPGAPSLSPDEPGGSTSAGVAADLVPSGAEAAAQADAARPPVGDVPDSADAAADATAGAAADAAADATAGAAAGAAAEATAGAAADAAADATAGAAADAAADATVGAAADTAADATTGAAAAGTAADNVRDAAASREGDPTPAEES